MKRIFKQPGILKKYTLMSHIVSGFELCPKLKDVEDEQEYTINNADTSLIINYKEFGGIDEDFDFDEEKEKNLLICVNRVSANINQIARRVNSSGNIYEEDIRSIQEGVDELRQQVKSFLFLLQKLKP